jgi:dihydroxyacetone kinase phosphotransfer subunit
VVGIVIVSHSASLAAGVVELAREMGGSELALEAAGGLDLPDHPLGTDAALIAAAIERASSGDGVLVLMDLGSAVLSAELALDLIDERLRPKVLLSGAPLVEGAVAAAVSARLGLELAEVAVQARSGLAPKQTHLAGGAAAPQEPAPPAPGAVAPAPQEPAPHPPASALPEIRFVVRNRVGLHARPAARFVQTAGAYDATVEVTNLTKGRGPASARSLVSVMTLGVEQGDEVAIRAAGRQARQALEALQALADDYFCDPDS